MRYHAIVENKLASVMMVTSLFLMWVSSCDKTPSSSSLSNIFNIQELTTTTELFGPFPVANAFGISLVMTPTLGFGIFAF